MNRLPKVGKAASSVAAALAYQGTKDNQSTKETKHIGTLLNTAAKKHPLLYNSHVNTIPGSLQATASRWGFVDDHTIIKGLPHGSKQFAEFATLIMETAKKNHVSKSDQKKIASVIVDAAATVDRFTRKNSASMSSSSRTKGGLSSGRVKTKRRSMRTRKTKRRRF